MKIDMKQLCQDISLDLLQYIDPTASRSDLKESAGNQAIANSDVPACDVGYWRHPAHQPALQLEPDSVEGLLPLNVREDDPPGEEASEEARTYKLFPNAFRVAGLKHVADNLCGSVLTSLPQ